MESSSETGGVQVMGHECSVVLVPELYRYPVIAKRLKIYVSHQECAM